MALFIAFSALPFHVQTVIAIPPINQPPVAENDSYRTAEDRALSVPAPGVLDNDSDPDGDLLTAVLVSDPSHGSLTLDADGSFTYTPDKDYHGEDEFTYYAFDGELYSQEATVTLNVTAVNDAPVAENDSYATAEDQALSVPAPGVLENDSDPDGDPFRAVLFSETTHGVLTPNADGSFIYTPELGFVGEDSFTYHAFDEQRISEEATVTVTVGNRAPVAVDDEYTTNEDETLEVGAPGVLDNDSDPDGDPLTAKWVSFPDHGNLIFTNDGSFTYIPYQDFYGTDSFTYQAFDGALYSQEATVSLNVRAVNDAPVVEDDSYATDVNETLEVPSPAGGVLANDSDPDGDPLTAILVSDPDHGSLTLNADGSFTYIPKPDFVGKVRFTYHAFDGELYSNTATVTVTVGNRRPVAVNDSYATQVNETLVVPASGVLANDSDPDGDSLAAVNFSVLLLGSLTPNADGSFTYIPEPDFVGKVIFTYHAFDGKLYSNQATVTVTVGNRPPVAVDDEYTTNEDETLEVGAPGVLDNDSDPDGDPLTAKWVSFPDHGSLTLNADGSFTYTPNLDFYGTDSFDYKANDGISDSNTATVTITVNPVNDPPVLESIEDKSVDELALLSFTAIASDSDIPPNTLTFSLVGAPSGAGITSGGDFTWTPTEAQGPGEFTFTVEVCDNGVPALCAEEIIIVTVNEVNLAPVCTGSTLNTHRNTWGKLIPDCADADGDDLTYHIVVQPAFGAAYVWDGELVYIPNPAFSGADSFTFKANDGTSDSNTATVNVTVDPLSLTTQAPRIPALRSPVNNRLVTTLTPSLDWKDSNAPSGTVFSRYQLQVATDRDFTNIVVERFIEGLSNSEHTITSAEALNHNTRYFWRVRAFNTFGQFRGWSGVRSFRVAMLPPDLVKPDANAALDNLRPEFDWEDVAGASSYTIQISARPDMRSPKNTKVTASTYTPTKDLSKNKTLYWRVRANGENGPSLWSEVRSIITPNTPTTPRLVSPKHKALVTTLNPKLDWSNSSLPIGVEFGHYQVQVATDSGFTAVVVNENIYELPNSEHTLLVALNPGTQYYWRVRAFNSLGHFSSWSAVRWFNTGTIK